MMGPFRRTNETRLYLPDGLGLTARVGYLLPHSTTAPPETLTLTQGLFEYPGWFLVFGKPKAPTAETFARLAEAAGVFFAHPAHTDALIAWFVNVDQAHHGLTGWTLDVPRPRFPVTTPLRLSRLSTLTYANHGLCLPPGCTLAATADGGGLTVTAPDAPQGEDAGRGGPALAVTPLGQTGPVFLAIAGTITVPLIAPEATAGCFDFALSLTQERADILDLGLRLYSATTGKTLAGKTPTGKTHGRVRSVRYPVFDLEHLDTVPLRALVDPLEPFHPERCGFRFAKPGVAIRSTYRSAAGGVLTLTPGAESRLVACIRPTALDAQGQPITTPGGAVLTFVPSGPFGLATPGGGVQISTPAGGRHTLADTLMCGISAVESFDLSDTPSVLTFITGAPAFTAAQPLAVLNGAPSGWRFHPLTATAETAWASLWRPGGALYSAQPEGAALHCPEPGSVFLRYLPMITGRLLPTPTPEAPSLASAFPLFGYARAEAGRGLTPEDVRQIEIQTLAPTRRAILTRRLSAPVNPAPPDAGQVVATTPQGLVLALNGTTWSKLTLACSPAPPPPGRSSTLAMTQVRGALKAALQSNPLFLVISAADALKACADFGADDFNLYVADWTFTLAPEHWEKHQTVLIFKFCSGPLRDRFDEPGCWADAATFNSDPQATKLRLQAIATDALTRRDKGETEFASFVDQVLLNPAWTGLLALNVPVPITALPTQLKGLAAGVEPARFYAHHIGISHTPVHVSGTTMTPKASAIFGLIDYRGGEPPKTAATDYHFAVSSLKIRIAQSEVKAFASTVELGINTLFGDPVRRANAAHGTIALSGAYQNAGGVGRYVFTSAGPVHFTGQGAIVHHVIIDEVRFVTLAYSQSSEAKPGGTVSTAFKLQGQLSLKSVPGLDLFSYGTTAPAPPGGLAFRDLTIAMRFDAATPSYKTFAFDAASLTLDTTTSQVRPDSLAAHFPMKLTGLVQGSGDLSPEKLGFLPVTLPIPSATLSGTWFGLRYDLDLGSPGALAGSVGFTAGLLLAWMPGGTPGNPAIAVGLKLPGGEGGTPALTLQGMIKLSFGAIRLLADPPAYSLELRAISLKLFGLTLPPDGQTNLVLFGNSAADTGGALGWYACYTAKQKQ